MKGTADILRYEFVGTEARIVRSQHTDYAGIHGKIIAETKNTFTILHKGKAKSVIKNLALFNLKFSDGTIFEIDGKLLMGRPEGRLKKSVKRFW